MLKREGAMDGDVQILQILGSRALSEFRLQHVLRQVQSAVPDVDSLAAKYGYFVACTTSFQAHDIKLLLNLIGAESVQDNLLASGDDVLAFPRLGTRSPWSSKATDILRRCGFEGIDRIERAVVWTIDVRKRRLTEDESFGVYRLLHDRMTESIVSRREDIPHLFDHPPKQSLGRIDVLSGGTASLHAANERIGLALSDAELDYIATWYRSQQRNPTDAELMMFSQVNSEHCRHKIFNAHWIIDGEPSEQSLFSMIRETHARNPCGTLVAYEDNASVIAGSSGKRFFPDPITRKYRIGEDEPMHVIYKAETHNHPTAISPFPGAATGAGGEIRDEGATGRGGRPKAGLCGFSVSHLRIPGYAQPWEGSGEFPSRFATPLQVMLEGPIGSASFNNEFGRPNTAGYFRTFESGDSKQSVRYGYHKPIMLAGGIGSIRAEHVDKRSLIDGSVLVVIGGPAMLIGLGGGAASSVGYGQSDEDLDFTSVQRSNPEMQRRCQEVINRCMDLGSDNPIVSIHDVGAGGLSNALPEIVDAVGLGAKIDLASIPCDDPSLSPMQIWCNEAQERYAIAIDPGDLEAFSRICDLERCPFAVVGTATAEPKLEVADSPDDVPDNSRPINIDMKFLMGGLPREVRTATRMPRDARSRAQPQLELDECIDRVLRFPSVGDKTFLITIGDRTVSGLVHRDQMVGPWQVPVADASVTLSGYCGFQGEAMALGERSPIAAVNAPASARMAIGESLTNLRSAAAHELNRVRLSANWMASAGASGSDAELYDSVRSVALDLCPALGISIPVGKDSLSMRTLWQSSDGRQMEMHAPLSLIATAFTALGDVRGSLTPQLNDKVESELLLIDLGQGKCRMGMSTLHQAFNVDTGEPPDLDDPGLMAGFYRAISQLISSNAILAYHDRSDGGLLATLCEMSFASRTGLRIDCETASLPAVIEYLFNEELGAVIQVASSSCEYAMEVFARNRIDHLVRSVGAVASGERVTIVAGNRVLLERSRTDLHRIWSELTWRMQSLRDNPRCAQHEYDRILDTQDPGLNIQVPASVSQRPAALRNLRPEIAVLREQGVNGHAEMAAAFNLAGFDAYDVLMSDICAGSVSLDRFNAMAICGGFSFGDVLGAGKGWASTILCDSRLRDEFSEFFGDTAKFALGVCNGCQVMVNLRDIIPGAQNWPNFARNESEQFEARLVMVQIPQSKSVITSDLAGCTLPVALAHGEGRAEFASEADYVAMAQSNEICLRYTDNRGKVSDRYPYNPNGSQFGTAGVTNSDGRITAMMPHPERVFRNVQHSWTDGDVLQDSLWMNLFRGARNWLG